MPRDQYLSYSQLSDFLRCRTLWDYNYRKRLQPSSKGRAPELGDAVHRSIAMALRGRNPEEGFAEWKANFIKRSGRSGFFDEELEAIDELEADCVATTNRALQFIRQTGLSTVTWNGVEMIEQRVSFPLPGWKGYVAVFDWVAQDPTSGFVWLIDWKVRASFQADLSEEVSLQMGTYQAVAQLAGYDVTGSRTLQIKAGQMAEPKLNKDGTMSRTDIRTDWPTYVAALQRAGLDPSDYQEMMYKLDAKEWQQWTYAYRGQTEVFNLWHNTVLPLAREMNRKTINIVRNMGYINCVGCHQRELCMADLRGHEWTQLPITDEPESTQGLLKWRNTSRQ